MSDGEAGGKVEGPSGGWASLSTSGVGWEQGGRRGEGRAAAPRGVVCREEGAGEEEKEEEAARVVAGGVEADLVRPAPIVVPFIGQRVGDPSPSPCTAEPEPPREERPNPAPAAAAEVGSASSTKRETT